MKSGFPGKRSILRWNPCACELWRCCRGVYEKMVVLPKTLTDLAQTTIKMSGEGNKLNGRKMLVEYLASRNGSGCIEILVLIENGTIDIWNYGLSVSTRQRPWTQNWSCSFLCGPKAIGDAQLASSQSLSSEPVLIGKLWAIFKKNLARSKCCPEEFRRNCAAP